MSEGSNGKKIHSSAMKFSSYLTQHILAYFSGTALRFSSWKAKAKSAKEKILVLPIEKQQQHLTPTFQHEALEAY